MSLVPTAAAQLAVGAKPAGRTHCQSRHVLTADTAVTPQQGLPSLPADPRGAAGRFCGATVGTDTPRPSLGAQRWAEQAEGLGDLPPFLLREKRPLGGQD